MSDLIIQISGDAANFEKALDKAQEKTEDLSDRLTDIAKVSAVAFAALTAEAYEASKAFAGAEQATNQLTRALQQQGIYSKDLVDSYRSIADEIQRKTGIDDDALISQMATFQGFVGQTRITKELTQAVVDLSVAGKMTTESAFDLVAKAATNNTEILKRYGIQVEDTGTRSGNLAAITEALSQKFGGQAEAAAQGLGGIEKMKAAFEDVQKAIGERLAPAVTAIINGFTKLFEAIADHQGLLDFLLSIGTAGAVVTALGVAVGTGAFAFLQLKAALEAAKIATTAMELATKGLVGAAGIGLLIVLASEIYLNWNSIWPRMQAVFTTFAENISALAMSLGKVIYGAISGDFSALSAGWDELKSALSKSLSTYNSVVDQKLAERQAIEDKAEDTRVSKNNANAAAEEAKLRAKEALRIQIARERNELLAMQAANASKESIALQQAEIQLLEQIEDDKNKRIVGKLRERLDQVQQMQVAQQEQEKLERATFNEEIATQTKEYQDLSAADKADFDQKNMTTLVTSIQTEKMTRENAAKDALQQQITFHNEFLKNQQKFGIAYAMINKLMHSEIFQGTKTATDDLTQLQTSSNATLKGIGKAAAVANIGIKTAESAMNIYAGFSTIPIIGPALGIVGAAAAVAFGAEQESQVLAAADGGLINGPGTSTSDSIPAMLSKGEVVVPARNFDEVINAVADQRRGAVNNTGVMAELVISLKDNLAEFIETKIVERQNLGISVMRSA